MDTQLNIPTNQNSIKVPKFVKAFNKKMLLKTFETSVQENQIVAVWLDLVVHTDRHPVSSI